MSGSGKRIGLGAVVAAVSIAIGGCGDASDTDEPPPQGPLAAALASLGGGGANGSLGVGWAEPDLVAGYGARAPGLIGDALGPNADTVIEAAPAFERRFGFDPLAAERLVSVGGSYAFGLRLDGVDASGLERALVADGGRTRPAGEIETLEIGGYASVPEPLLDLDVNGLGAFDAFGERVAVLAISETARATLLGRGGRLIEQPIYAAAADCLGDAVAVRMIPAKLALSTELGVNLFALGVTDDRELLCVLGGTAERAAEIETALRASLAVDARDPRSGERIGDSVTAAAVTTDSYDGVEVVRVELTPAPGAAPGFVFAALARGSLVSMISPG
jgi:hypothetical protein